MEFITASTSPRRAQLTARLAAERSGLYLQLEGLDEATLGISPVTGEWTAAGLLAHIGYWDALYADRLTKLVDGRRGEIQPVASLDERNAAVMERLRGLRFNEAVAIAQKERRNFLSAFGRVPDELLFRRVRLEPGWRPSAYGWARQQAAHDAGHAAELARWRRQFPPNDPSLRVIHHTLLRPLLGLSRQEFLALAALVPPDARETEPLASGWTLKQTIGHLADYEGLGIIALKAVAAGREPNYPAVIDDFDAYNAARLEALAAESWNETWASYLAARRALTLIIETLPDEALARPFLAPWGQTTTACGYLLDMARHEQEHADILRQSFELPPLPRRLNRAS